MPAPGSMCALSLWPHPSLARGILPSFPSLDSQVMVDLIGRPALISPEKPQSSKIYLNFFNREKY